MNLMPLGSTTSSSFSTFLQDPMLGYGSISLMMPLASDAKEITYSEQNSVKIIEKANGLRTLRVLICSETTPTARKAAHARPAPSPNRLVKVEAIQSVESTLVVDLCCSTFDGAGLS
uniref:Uncharacterized protein n=1 Tax=Cucumis melo TaxID=3656 RepID=A0A9I9EMG2_CUCME